jgi:hypothetical protein
LCHAQTYLPQIADGGNWYTAVVLVNTSLSSATASVNFFQDGTNGATTPWNPPFVEVTSTQNLTIPAGGTLYMHTLGTAATLAQGWGQVTAPAGVTAYAIYTYESFEGRPNQDGTSLAVAGTSRILVPFDATTGYSTGVAIVNPSAAQETVSVNIQTDDGTVTQTSLPALPANGQLAFSIATQFPVTAGHRGVAEFYVSTGAISIAAFRINPTIALTSLPVVLASGPPVLGGGVGSITLPQFRVVVATVNLSATDSGGNPITVGLADTLQIVGVPSQTGYAGASLSGSLFLSPTDVVFFNSELTGVSLNGNTFTVAGNLAQNSFEISLVSGTKVPITFATATLTLTPQQSASQGSVTGTFTLVVGGTTTMGTLSGTYTAQM